MSEQRLFQITLLGGVHEQRANLPCPRVRNACDFWELNLVLEFVVACCGPNVMLVMYRGIGVSNIWTDGKQQESLRDSKEAPPEWEEIIIQSMNLWLEAASGQLLGNILQMQEMSCALPESSWLGTHGHPHFCPSFYDRLIHTLPV